MTDIATLAAGGVIATDRTTLNTNFAALQRNCISATAPASPLSGQFWIDSSTATEILKIYDGAAWRTLAPDVFLAGTGGGLLPTAGGTLTGNLSFGGTAKCTSLAVGSASGDSITYGQVQAIVQSFAVPLGDISATNNKYIFVGGPGTTVINDVGIVSELGVASNATDYWTFQVRNVTAALDLRSAVKSTDGAAITADTYYALGLGQNLTPAASAVLRLQMVKAGSPNTLTDAVAIVRYTITPA